MRETPSAKPTQIESEVHHGIPTGPEISKDQVVAAVQDLTEFVEHMKTMMNAEGGKKDLGMRGMFQLVDEQVEVLKRVSHVCSSTLRSEGGSSSSFRSSSSSRRTWVQRG